MFSLKKMEKRKCLAFLNENTAVSMLLELSDLNAPSNLISSAINSVCRLRRTGPKEETMSPEVEKQFESWSSDPKV